MKKAILYTFVLILSALTALSFAQMSAAAEAEIAVRHIIVAASGDAVPVGGNYNTSSFSNARLNARHEIVFDAVVAGPPFTTGVFVGDGKRTSVRSLVIRC